MNQERLEKLTEDFGDATARSKLRRVKARRGRWMYIVTAGEGQSRQDLIKAGEAIHDLGLALLGSTELEGVRFMLTEHEGRTHAMIVDNISTDFKRALDPVTDAAERCAIEGNQLRARQEVDLGRLRRWPWPANIAYYWWILLRHRLLMRRLAK